MSDYTIYLFTSGTTPQSEIQKFSQAVSLPAFSNRFSRYYRPSELVFPVMFADVPLLLFLFHKAGHFAPKSNQLPSSLPFFNGGDFEGFDVAFPASDLGLGNTQYTEEREKGSKFCFCLQPTIVVGR